MTDGPVEAFLGGDVSHSVEGELVALEPLVCHTAQAFLPVIAEVHHAPVVAAPCQLPHAGVAVLHVLDVVTVFGEVVYPVVGQAYVVAVEVEHAHHAAHRVVFPFLHRTLGVGDAHAPAQQVVAVQRGVPPAVGGFREVMETVIGEPRHHAVGVFHRCHRTVAVGHPRDGTFGVGAAHQIARAVIAELPRAAVRRGHGYGTVAQVPLAGVHGGHAAAARVGAVGAVPPAVISVQGAVTERVRLCEEPAAVVVTPQVFPAVGIDLLPHKAAAVVVHRQLPVAVEHLGHSLPEREPVVVYAAVAPRVHAARTHARTVVLEVPRKAVAPCLLHDEPSGILVCHHVARRVALEGHVAVGVVLVGGEGNLFLRIFRMRAAYLKDASASRVVLHPQAAARAVGDGAQQALFRVVEADAQAVAVGHALKQAHGIVLLAREAVVEVLGHVPHAVAAVLFQTGFLALGEDERGFLRCRQGEGHRDAVTHAERQRALFRVRDDAHVVGVVPPVAQRPPVVAAAVPRALP